MKYSKAGLISFIILIGSSCLSGATMPIVHVQNMTAHDATLTWENKLGEKVTQSILWTKCPQKMGTTVDMAPGTKLTFKTKPKYHLSLTVATPLQTVLNKWERLKPTVDDELLIILTSPHEFGLELGYAKKNSHSQEGRENIASQQ